MRVNVDDKLYTDPRVTLAAAALGMNRFEFIGRVIAVWMAAYQNRSALMPARSVDALAQHCGFADAMLAEDLATNHEGQLWLRGVTERIEFLLIQDAKREKANAVKRERAGVAPARPPGHPAARPPGLPYSLTLAPTPTPTPTPTQAQAQAQAQAHERVAARAASDAHPEAIRLAGVLVDRIASMQPGTKIAKLSAEARERKALSWSADVDKLHRLDGIAWPDIEAVIMWATADDFWAPNILSGTKLRDKYDQLVAQMKRQGSKATAGGRAEPSAPRTFESDALKTANGGVPW